MAKINKANIKKTIYYLKRNGLRDTCLAALERLREKEDYRYEEPSVQLLESQRKEVCGKEALLFSIVVPTYNTKKEYLTAMIESVLAQSYPRFELILADASDNAQVQKQVLQYQDDRIRYLSLTENEGISENTNRALEYATGDYIGLLDHDDLLAPDALYENYKAIMAAKEKGFVLNLLYSDEDKCDTTGTRFYEPHYKLDFNLDLFLSNNYICHFTVIRAELIKELAFRREYDGAQDYDLFLRTVLKSREEQLYHIPKMLYHWRCHTDSTAENPESKQYAYEAGRRALEDFCRAKNWKATVKHTAHLGFYEISYLPDILSVRKDVGIVGGPIYKKGKFYGGIYDAQGKCPYAGLRKGYGGYLHRAKMPREAIAVDIRNCIIREEYKPLKEKLEKAFFQERERNEVNYRKCSILFCKKVKEKGSIVLYRP